MPIPTSLNTYIMKIAHWAFTPIYIKIIHALIATVQITSYKNLLLDLLYLSIPILGINARIILYKTYSYQERSGSIGCLYIFSHP